MKITEFLENSQKVAFCTKHVSLTFNQFMSWFIEEDKVLFDKKMVSFNSEESIIFKTLTYIKKIPIDIIEIVQQKNYTIYKGENILMSLFCTRYGVKPTYNKIKLDKNTLKEIITLSNLYYNDDNCNKGELIKKLKKLTNGDLVFHTWTVRNIDNTLNFAMNHHIIKNDRILNIVCYQSSNDDINLLNVLKSNNYY